MEYFAAPLQNLIEEFEKLPGIGSKTAQRLAFYVLNQPKEKAEKFANAIVEAKKTLCYARNARIFLIGRFVISVTIPDGTIV